MSLSQDIYGVANPAGIQEAQKVLDSCFCRNDPRNVLLLTQKPSQLRISLYPENAVKKIQQTAEHRFTGFIMIYADKS